jgi:hypothetical protein
MKKVITILITLFLLAALCACNYNAIDLVYHFDRAILHLPDGEIVEGPVDSWRDYEDGDQIQVTIYGVTYLAHSTDVVLISENDGR